MVPSLAIIVAIDSERLTCSGFSLGESIHLRNFEFITHYFGGLILSPRRGDEGTVLMGSTRSGALLALIKCQFHAPTYQVNV
jgi:hypothetical protein